MGRLERRRQGGRIIGREPESPYDMRGFVNEDEAAETLHVVDAIVFSEVLIESVPLFLGEVDLLELTEIPEFLEVGHIELGWVTHCLQTSLALNAFTSRYLASVALSLSCWRCCSSSCRSINYPLCLKYQSSKA